MAVAAGKHLDVLHRRAQVAELYVQGHTQASIARQLAVGQPTISADLKAIQREWRNSAIRDFDAARELELQKLDRVEREAWQAWDRSQKPAQSAVVTESSLSPKTTKTVRNQHGDLRALEIVLKCSESRRLLLGLDAPTRIAPVMPDGREPYRLAVAQLNLDELRVLKELRARTAGLTLEAHCSTEAIDDASV